LVFIDLKWKFDIISKKYLSKNESIYMLNGLDIKGKDIVPPVLIF
jgi:hypothetical protein